MFTLYKTEIVGVTLCSCDLEFCKYFCMSSTSDKYRKNMHNFQKQLDHYLRNNCSTDMEIQNWKIKFRDEVKGP